MIKLKLILLFTIIILISGCTEFAILMSGSSLAISQNTYARMYNAVDVLTIMNTEKGIKQHAYEKGKKYIVDWSKAKADWAKAKALGITTKH
jgi:uncharacterized protein YceK